MIDRPTTHSPDTHNNESLYLQVRIIHSHARKAHNYVKLIWNMQSPDVHHSFQQTLGSVYVRTRSRNVTAAIACTDARDSPEADVVTAFHEK